MVVHQSAIEWHLSPFFLFPASHSVCETSSVFFKVFVWTVFQNELNFELRVPEGSQNH